MFISEYYISFELRLPWSYLGNRPFLRLYFFFGQTYMYMKDWNKAREVFENIIWMNPTDNQGARWELIKVYFELKKFESITKLCELYKDEFSALMSVNCILALLKLKRYKKAERLIKDVVKHHAITLEYILEGKADELDFEPEYFIPFGRSEGYFYFRDFYEYWDQDSIKFLKKFEGI